MGDSQSVELGVQVRSMGVQYKRDPSATAFQYPTPQPAYEAKLREADPNYVNVQLLFQDKDERDFVLNMLLSTEYAKKLNLMVGDSLTIKLTKTAQ